MSSSSKNRTKRRRDRDHSRSLSPEHRRRKRRSRSSSREISHSRQHSSSENDSHKKSRRQHSPSDWSEDSDRYHHHSSKHSSRHHGNSSGHGRRRKERYRSRSRSHSPRREHRKRRKEKSRSIERRRRHRERSLSNEKKGRSSSNSPPREGTESSKNKSTLKSDDDKVSAAENLRAKVKALLAKSSEGTAETTNTLCSDVITAPTPGQISLIESNSFTADKFVSKRSSKKWDVPPSQHNEKKTFTSKSSFDATAVDPSEFVPKVVPMCEVESAMGREGEMGVSEESGRDVVSIKQKNEDSTTELQPKDKWLHKLKKMRQKFVDLPTD